MRKLACLLLPVTLLLSCDSSSPTAPIVDPVEIVAGVWTGSASLNTIEPPNNCVSQTFQPFLPMDMPMHLSLTQSGSDLVGRLVWGDGSADDDAADLAGRIDGRRINLSSVGGEACVYGFPCLDGKRRDVCATSLSVTGTLGDGVISGQFTERDATYREGTRQPTGQLTLRGDFDVYR